MTFDQFNKYQEQLLAQVVAMKDTKGREYANSESRFANFDRLSTQLNLKNYQIGWVYLAKHLDSIASFCKSGRTFSTETIQGRIVDAIAYLTLIGGMIQESENIKSRADYQPPQDEFVLAADLNEGKHQPFKYDPIL